MLFCTEIYELDVSNEQQVKTAIEDLQKKFGSLHILVNSAGIVGATNIKSHDTPTQDLKTVNTVCP